MRWSALALLVPAFGLAGCEPDLLPGTGGPAPGRVCYVNEDCVPADCCGESSSVVHRAEAPSCTGVSCNTNCDPSQLNCNCGQPICRDSRCAPALGLPEDCR